VTGLRVLVVDDEPLAREMVAALARADAHVSAIEECGEATRALAMVESFEPDVVFLDVQMPELDGIRIAENLSETGPVVVFITAHEEYAMEAFEVGAIDYLLKPFSDARFHEALARANRRVQERRLARDAPPLGAVRPAADGRETVLEFGSLRVPASDIAWIEAQDYYVRIHTSGQRHLVRATLASFEERLDPASFVRVHRNAIVNRDSVRGTQELEGRLRLSLADGSEISVSRARRRATEAALRASRKSPLRRG
jgi:two-component system LytT family response regulator